MEQHQHVEHRLVLGGDHDGLRRHRAAPLDAQAVERAGDREDGPRVELHPAERPAPRPQHHGRPGDAHEAHQPVGEEEVDRRAELLHGASLGVAPGRERRVSGFDDGCGALSSGAGAGAAPVPAPAARAAWGTAMTAPLLQLVRSGNRAACARAWSLARRGL